MSPKYSGPLRFMILAGGVIGAWLLVLMIAGAVLTLAQPSTVDPDPTAQPWSMNQ
jgi:hypothetical protein